MFSLKGLPQQLLLLIHTACHGLSPVGLLLSQLVLCESMLVPLPNFLLPFISLAAPPCCDLLRIVCCPTIMKESETFAPCPVHLVSSQRARTNAWLASRIVKSPPSKSHQSGQPMKCVFDQPMANPYDLRACVPNRRDMSRALRYIDHIEDQDCGTWWVVGTRVSLRHSLLVKDVCQSSIPRWCQQLCLTLN